MSLREPLVGIFNKEFEEPTDLLCCAFGFRETETKTYFALIEGPKTIEQLGELPHFLGKDRSTIQRVLNKLHKNNLVERRKHFIERGGYYYEYHAISSEKVRKELLAQLDRWYETTRSFLKQSWAETPQ